MNPFTKTSEQLPPRNGASIWWLEDGMEIAGTFRNGIFLRADGSDYNGYVPEWWRLRDGV